MTSRNNKLSNNKQVLQEAEHVQDKTRESLLRIQQQAAEAEILGTETLSELHSQKQQLHSIEKETKKLHSHLSHSNKLQNRMDRWALNWRGTHKRQAKKEAQLHMKLKEKKSSSTATVEQYKASNNKTKSKKNKNNVLLTTDDNNDNRAPPQALSEEDKQALSRIEENDADIDAMLDSASDALDRLDFLAMSMKEEAQAHGKVIDTHTESITKAHTKQQVLNGRMKRMLGIKS